MNKLLMSGTGKDANLSVEWVATVIGSIVIFLTGVFLANQIGYTESWLVGRVRNDFYYFALYFFLALSILTFCLCVYMIMKMRKTELSVYENSVEGIGLNSNENNPFAEAVTFKLDYDKVASVDATNRKLTINAYGKVFIIFLHNPHLYAETINKQINKAAQPKNVTTESSPNVKKAMFCADCGECIVDSTKAFCPGCGAKR